MADRSDFYYEQEVTQAEMDQAFSDMENADRNLIVDHTEPGSSKASSIWGVLTGLEVSERSGTPDLNVEIADGVAYDEQGRRIPHSGGPTLLDLTTAVPGSDSRYVRVYAEFSRVLSDPRTDGLGASIDYRQEEGVAFSFDLGTPAASPVKPTLLTDKVCLATVLIASGATQIFNADISDALPSVGGLSIPDRQEGGVIAHGGLVPTRRKLHFGIHPTPGGEEVLNLGTGNHMNLQGGQLRMSTIGSDGGQAIYGEMASVYKVGEVRVGGNIQDGGGYWYGDSAGDEFGEPLQALNKYLAFDPSMFYPGGQTLTPMDPTLSANHWRFDKNGSSPAYSCGWETNVTITSGQLYQNPLFCALPSIPFRAQLVGLEWEVEVVTNRVELEFGCSLHRRGIARNDVTIVSNSGSVATTALTTGNRTLDAGTVAHLARPDLYVYYAVFWIKAVAANTNLGAGIYVGGCRLRYQIREASGEYYHPTL